MKAASILLCLSVLLRAALSPIFRDGGTSESKTEGHGSLLTKILNETAQSDLFISPQGFFLIYCQQPALKVSFKNSTHVAECKELKAAQAEAGN